ncbi:LacI family DNA-binding transcriptional regulator [Agromyces mangrovi Wang et al. 2018]|uniref:LacI family DNA-binding transcriptional regulator n=1 Tax=Agromyces mangrovi TaxID=1858653 RepID=UPI0025737531|nr:LacI family DNA-binding transcriptional regulator [Agromyces mangrovi]BDZ65336.1 transcriptional regulator [Agromyces mangrovi]
MTDQLPRRPARISDVARLAGVSLGTVSHALNHPSRVRPATLERVNDAIRELGFVRNANASTLATGRSSNIGMVAIAFGNSMFVDIARGAQRVARRAGYNLLLAGSEDSYDTQGEFVGFFDEARVAGMLLAPMVDSSEHVERMASHGRPVVLMNYDGHEDACRVVVDNEQVGYLAARHLLERGCRRITVLGGGDQFQPVQLRRRGIHRAIEEAGDAVAVDTVTTDGLTPEAGAAAVAPIAAAPAGERPDGLLCLTDAIAIGAIRGLQSAGLDVPGDLLVMGCDHNTQSWDGDVTLTTISMRGLEIGEAAMELLLEELRTAPSEHTHRRVVLEPRIEVRSSTTRASSR